MKTFKQLTASLALLLLAGCETPPAWYQPQVWYQNGKSYADTQRDVDDCRVDAARDNNRLTMTHHWHYSEIEDNFIYNCMTAKGYWPVDNRRLPAGAPMVSKYP